MYKRQVAVIEAGPSGYEDNDKFIVPSAMLYDSAVNTQYDWQYKTTSQKHLNGKEKSWPRGKVLVVAVRSTVFTMFVLAGKKLTLGPSSPAKMAGTTGVGTTCLMV